MIPLYLSLIHIYEGKEDVPYNAAYHGYWASDFTKLNPTMGTTEEFKTMISEAHKRLSLIHI